jgi:hypothetical protein
MRCHVLYYKRIVFVVLLPVIFCFNNQALLPPFKLVSCRVLLVGVAQKMVTWFMTVLGEFFPTVRRNVLPPSSGWPELGSAEC